jgi:hypothetical protein
MCEVGMLYCFSGRYCAGQCTVIIREKGEGAVDVIASINR